MNISARQLRGIAFSSIRRGVHPTKFFPKQLSAAARSAALSNDDGTTSSAIDEHLTEVAQEIAQCGAKPVVEPRKLSDQKWMFSVEPSFCNVFSSRIVQQDIRGAIGQPSPSRIRCLHALHDILRSKVPKTIASIDLKAFFESVGFQLALEDLESHRRLKPFTRDYLDALRRQAEPVGCTGLLRGVGACTVMAEFCAQRIREDIATESGAIASFRFVDDMVMVGKLERGKVLADTRATVTQAVGRYGVELNEDKSQFVEIHSTQGDSREFDFLGHRFRAAESRVTVSISESKIEKLNGRVESAKAAYETSPSHQKNAAYKLLRDRMGYLAGSVVVRRGSGAFVVGLRSSMPILTDLKQLRSIDKKFERWVNTHLQDQSQQRRRSIVRSSSFEIGYNQRRMRPYNKVRMAQITAAWRYDGR